MPELYRDTHHISRQEGEDFVQQGGGSSEDAMATSEEFCMDLVI